MITNYPTIKVKLDDGAYLPERAHATDAGADIRTPVSFTLPARGSAVIHTGVHVETPHECVTLIKSKSGLNVMRGITSEGVVDEGYDGEIVVKLYNHSDTEMHFEAGDKITQILVMPVLYPTYVEASQIHRGERGSNGFGSTGRL